MIVLSSINWTTSQAKSGKNFHSHTNSNLRGVLCYVFCVEIVTSNRNLRATLQMLSDILVALFDSVCHSYWYCFLKNTKKLQNEEWNISGNPNKVVWTWGHLHSKCRSLCDSPKSLIILERVLLQKPLKIQWFSFLTPWTSHWTCNQDKIKTL